MVGVVVVVGKVILRWIRRGRKIKNFSVPFSEKTRFSQLIVSGIANKYVLPSNAIFCSVLRFY